MVKLRSKPTLDQFGFFYLNTILFWSIVQQSLNLQSCLFLYFLFKKHPPIKKNIAHNQRKIVIKSDSYLGQLTTKKIKNVKWLPTLINQYKQLTKLQYFERKERKEPTIILL